MSDQDETKKQLIDCPACGKKMGLLAKACPDCGSPNDWVHPKIKTFLKRKDDGLAKDIFEIEYTKVEIAGETAPRTPWWAFPLVLFCGVQTYMWGIVASITITVVSFLIIRQVFGKTKSFKANVATGEWTSNDDKFWHQVKEVLEL